MSIPSSQDVPARVSVPVRIAAFRRFRAVDSGLMITIAALVISIPRCGPVQTDFTHSFAGDYELVRTSVHQVIIVPKGGWSDDTPKIPSKVVEVAWDDRFILAKRQHLKRRGMSPSDGYEEPVDGKFDYWILDTRRPTGYGPFDEAEFGNQRKELGISELLPMRDVSSFSPYRQ